MCRVFKARCQLTRCTMCRAHCRASSVNPEVSLRIWRHSVQSSSTIRSLCNCHTAMRPRKGREQNRSYKHENRNEKIRITFYLKKCPLHFNRLHLQSLSRKTQLPLRHCTASLYGMDFIPNIRWVIWYCGHRNWQEPVYTLSKIKQ